MPVLPPAATITNCSSNLLDVHIPVVSVATITLDNLLDRNGVESIDLLSMDIELGVGRAGRL